MAEQEAIAAGLHKDYCPYSDTGLAWHTADGDCTCKGCDSDEEE